jgi:4-hydroxybenzoyl-CoA thioesterase
MYNVRCARPHGNANLRIGGFELGVVEDYTRSLHFPLISRGPAIESSTDTANTPAKTATMLVNNKTIHIEWGDCDPLGIVYFPRYFEFFDACTNALFEQAGLPKPELLRKYEIAGIPLVDARCRFILSSAFGDRVNVESAITKWGTSSFSVGHRLYKGELLAVEGFETRVWVVREPLDPRGIRSQTIPQELIDRFGPLEPES